MSIANISKIPGVGRLDRFGVALGSYAGLLVVSGLLLAVPGRPLVAVTAGLGVAAVVVPVSSHRAGLAAVLWRRRLHVLLAAVPLVAAFVVDLPGLDVLQGLIAGLMYVGVVLYFATGVQYADWLVDRERSVTEWSADVHSHYRNYTILVFVIVLALLFAFVVTFASSSGESSLGISTLVAAVVSGLFAALFGSGNRGLREFTALESGLVVAGEARRGYGSRTVVYPWERLTGYTRTDEELLVHRRFQPTAIHCDLSDIDDPDAVERALAEHLDHTESTGLLD